ncbi:hypothetical protein CAPTEDRAFT_196659 [Capitella teleta]|uniref:Uncharacterized protein n=1 Tax=Capitella teleta TaxID=283909 RepID=R7UGW1_CAPTE|nr:hypothetical protein CAPTEDRAFT_196659 [Capitella teleta]|eukprot:ELU02497.1 hypothetical protein CAPTEDRAFT_196659 [Capitella teleta]
MLSRSPLPEEEKARLGEHRSAHLQPTSKPPNYSEKQPIWFTDDASKEWCPGTMQQKNKHPDSYWITPEERNTPFRRNAAFIENRKPCTPEQLCTPDDSKSASPTEPGNHHGDDCLPSATDDDVVPTTSANTEVGPVPCPATALMNPLADTKGTALEVVGRFTPLRDSPVLPPRGSH